jgi:acyl-CoA synthetase (AMP-forming)/AMP-acid ligase II
MEGVKMSYAEMLSRATAVAWSLLELGLHKGDRVGSTRVADAVLNVFCR